jgi:2-polyprenyl-3-methyl-5-hydroxy-6-metoxy-1,4-benzoquinol methylase
MRHACPGCASAGGNLLFSGPLMAPPVSEFIRHKFVGAEVGQHLDGHEYILVECDHCGLIYQRNILDGALTELLYDRWLNAEASQELLDHGGKQLSMRILGGYLQEAAKLVSFIGGPPHMIDVLDYGMGWGRWCLAAKALGCNVFGFDLSETRNEFARGNGITVVDGETLGGRQYDYISTEQVLEHVPDPLAMTRFLCAALKPGGILKISVPDGSSVKEGIAGIRWGEGRQWKGFRKYLMPITPLIHINTFSPSSIRHMARVAGLEEVHVPLRHDFALVPMSSWREVLRNTLRPLYRKLRPTTRLFFRKPGE